MTPGFERLSFLFYHSTLVRPLLHPLLHSAGALLLLVSLGTLAFYRQRALTFEARGSRVGGNADWGGERWVLYGEGREGREWWRVEIKKKREKGRLSLRGGRQAIEGTVGALNPFKYNQYRWEGVRTFHPLGYMDMIFTVHSRTTRKPRADARVRTLATLGHPLTARNIHQLSVSPCIFY